MSVSLYLRGVLSVEGQKGEVISGVLHCGRFIPESVNYVVGEFDYNKGLLDWFSSEVGVSDGELFVNQDVLTKLKDGLLSKSIVVANIDECLSIVDSAIEFSSDYGDVYYSVGVMI